MTTANPASSKSKSAKSNRTNGKDTSASHAGAEEMAQATFDRFKDAIPSFDEMADTLRAQTNVDLKSLSDDAATFVRRNPATSLAAAAGVGILIGLLVTKRS